MMSDEEIYRKLTTIFREVFDDDDLSARPDLTSEDVPGWDSLSHIQLILTVVREFRTQFSAAEITELKNVGDLAALLKRKMLVASDN
ncbi:MAG TPA: acyl carrier protein [Stellaceae bacterium]|nr:acyl carrier protein [Stellaceae bacterium]